MIHHLKKMHGLMKAKSMRKDISDEDAQMMLNARQKLAEEYLSEPGNHNNPRKDRILSDWIDHTQKLKASGHLPSGGDWRSALTPAPRRTADPMLEPDKVDQSGGQKVDESKVAAMKEKYGIETVPLPGAGGKTHNIATKNPVSSDELAGYLTEVMTGSATEPSKPKKKSMEKAAEQHPDPQYPHKGADVSGDPETRDMTPDASKRIGASLKKMKAMLAKKKAPTLSKEEAEAKASEMGYK